MLPTNLALILTCPFSATSRPTKSYCLPSPGLFPPESHACTRRTRHQASFIVRYIALDHPHRAPLLDHSPHSDKASFPDRLQEVDLEFERCEGFTLVEIGRVGDPHRDVGYVAEHAAMQRAHRVGVRFGRLKLYNPFAGFDRDQVKADQSCDWRWGRVSPNDCLTVVEQLCHGLSYPDLSMVEIKTD